MAGSFLSKKTIGTQKIRTSWPGTSFRKKAHNCLSDFGVHMSKELLGDQGQVTPIFWCLSSENKKANQLPEP